MTLLFDQNLSPRLIQALTDVFPGSLHVRDLGLAAADDTAIWDYAAKQGLVIVSKDSDFRQRSFLFGSPPKVICVCLGNCTTYQVEQLLRDRADDIRAFIDETESAILLVS